MRGWCDVVVRVINTHADGSFFVRWGMFPLVPLKYIGEVHWRLCQVRTVISKDSGKAKSG